MATAKNSMIMGGLTLAMRPLGLVGTVILARLLDPFDFGMVALAMVYVGSTELFAGLSMSQAYVQSELDEEKAAFHAFLITVTSSSLVFLFSYVNADWVASILGDPEVTPVLRALSLLIPITALGRVPASILRKQLKFGALAKSQFAATVAYLLVAILSAYLGFGIWSLVGGYLARALIELAFVWILTPGWAWLRPVPLDRSIFSSLLRFGLPATGSGLIFYFSSKWDDWLVGRQLGIESLGFYSKAYDLTNNTIRQFGRRVVTGVFFPTYARIRDDKERMQRAYFKSVQLVSTIMFPLALGLFATAPLLVTVVFGEKWIPMIPTFQVFAILVLTRPISGNAASIFNATGMPQHNLYAGLVLVAVMMPLALVLLPYGIVGVAVAVLIGDTAGLLYNLYRINRMLSGAGKATLMASLPSFISATIMTVAVVVLQILLTPALGANIWSLAIVVISGAVVFFLGIWLVQREFTKDMLQTVIQVIDQKGRLARVRSVVRSM